MKKLSLVLLSLIGIDNIFGHMGDDYYNHHNYMMGGGGYGFMALFWLMTWILIMIALGLAIMWLYKQIQKK